MILNMMKKTKTMTLMIWKRCSVAFIVMNIKCLVLFEMRCLSEKG